jgi:Glyoxalase-like domain
MVIPFGLNIRWIIGFFECHWICCFALLFQAFLRCSRASVNRWLSPAGFNNLVFRGRLVNNFPGNIEELEMKTCFTALLALFAFVTIGNAKAEDVMIDHIIWGGANLAQSAQQLENLSGVQPVFGGAHPGGGTANYLISLGPRTYLEAIGPDPEQNGGESPFLPVLLATEGQNVHLFAVSTSEIELLAQKARALGLETTGPTPGSRQKPDGELLRWQALFFSGHDFGPYVPFVIDWLDSTHPATTSPAGARLVSVTVIHPQAQALAALYQALGIPASVKYGETPDIIVTLDTPNGTVVLH